MSNGSNFEFLNLYEIQFYTYHLVHPSYLMVGVEIAAPYLRMMIKVENAQISIYILQIHIFISKKVLCFFGVLYRRKQQEKAGNQKKCLSLGPVEFWTASGYIKKQHHFCSHPGLCHCFVFALYLSTLKNLIILEYWWKFHSLPFFISSYYFYILLVHSTWFDYIYPLLQIFPNEFTFVYFFPIACVWVSYLNNYCQGISSNFTLFYFFL